MIPRSGRQHSLIVDGVRDYGVVEGELLVGIWLGKSDDFHEMGGPR